MRVRDRQPRAAGRGIVTGTLRRPWTVLICWTGLWTLLHAFDHGWSWHYQITGTRALFSQEGLHLYAQHPELQMGPLSFVVGAPVVLPWSNQAGLVSGVALMLVVGLLIVRELRGLQIAGRALDDRTWLFCSLVIMAVWTELAVRWGHLDDAMALYLAILGVRTATRGKPYIAALLLALSADFKPWTVPLAAILLAAPKRQWLALAGIWITVVAAAWTPFVLADPGTLNTAHFTIPVSPGSTLNLLGLAGQQTPPWCRYAQLLGGFAVAAVAVRRGRIIAVLLISVAVRLLLDPGTKNYYDAGLMLAAGMFDVGVTATLVPFATLAAAALIYAPPYLLTGAPTLNAVLRTGTLLALTAAALLMPRNPLARTPPPKRASNTS